MDAHGISNSEHVGSYLRNVEGSHERFVGVTKKFVNLFSDHAQDAYRRVSSMPKENLIRTPGIIIPLFEEACAVLGAIHSALDILEREPTTAGIVTSLANDAGEPIPHDVLEEARFQDKIIAEEYSEKS